MTLNSTIPQAVLKEAYQWLGTPYRHGAARKQVGCDCLGLIRGVWREVYGHEPEKPATYAPDWAELSDKEPLLDAAEKHMVSRPVPMGIKDILPAQVLIFRWQPTMAAKHIAIMGHEGRFIHAYHGHRVLTSALVPQWFKRIAGIFEFPEPAGQSIQGRNL
ncbi:NlpC/P60 family protein [Paenochrobactrum sp. BZR 588]|uniref:NlpC/P60 family protein n=1 Tax=Paenochrobactrum TaxID=999488 RepID=UPI0035BBAA1D